jgi:hypothetical protein
MMKAGEVGVEFDIEGIQASCDLEKRGRVGRDCG